MLSLGISIFMRGSVQPFSPFGIRSSLTVVERIDREDYEEDYLRPNCRIDDR